MKKFWKWKKQTVTNQETQEQTLERTLFLNGTIAEESWFDDDITPKLFRDELFAGNGDITIWINVKIDGIAASAASVIAMAGTKVLVSPVSMLMIHNPMTAAMGDTTEMQKAIAMLDEVKESIINAYEIKTGMSRAKLSHLMDAETWMDAHTAIDMGFADEILTRPADTPVENNATGPILFSRATVTNSLMDKLAAKCRIKKPETPERSVDTLMERLDLIKQHI